MRFTTTEIVILTCVAILATGAVFSVGAVAFGWAGVAISAVGLISSFASYLGGR